MAAVLVAAIAIAACGGDPAPTSTPVPTATPAATATPEPTPTRVPPPTPTPARDRLPLGLLRIDSETTGERLLMHLSPGEDTCFKSMMGDSKFKAFEEAVLMAAVADPSFRTRLVVCLQRDSLLIVGTRLIGAHLGGWTQETRQCVTAIALDRPELVFKALGVPDVGADSSETDNPGRVLLDTYDCLDTTEKARFAVAMLSNSIEDLSRISAETLALGVGAVSEDSRSCVLDFASANGQFLGLVHEYAGPVANLNPEDSLEIAEGGSKVFNCLTVEEIEQFQEKYLPSLLP